MSEEKLTYLLFLYRMHNQKFTITHMASQLGVSKSTVSKVLSVFLSGRDYRTKGKTELSKAGCNLAKNGRKR